MCSISSEASSLVTQVLLRFKLFLHPNACLLLSWKEKIRGWYSIWYFDLFSLFTVPILHCYDWNIVISHVEIVKHRWHFFDIELPHVKYLGFSLTLLWYRTLGSPTLNHRDENPGPAQVKLAPGHGTLVGAKTMPRSPSITSSQL